MSVRVRNILLMVIAFALAVGAAAFVYRFAGRPSDEAQPALPFQQGGIRVSLVPRAGVGGPNVAEAAAGDWLFESDRVRLVVGGEGDGVERRLRFGSIVDLVTRDFGDEKLVEFRAVLQIGGKLVGTRASGVRLETGGPRPVLRLLQASRDGSISLETELRLVPGAPFVELVTRDGQGFLELPSGRYRVLATHGTEYSIATEELEVNPDVGVTFRASLAHEVDTTGYLACDFHLHQAPSFDSTVSLEDRVLSLLSEGIEFAVPTDHNHVTDFTDTIAALDAERDLGTTSGVEVTTQSWGHFNAFPYPASAPVPPFAVDPPEIFAAVRAHAPDAVVQVNHPRMPGVGYFNRGELDARSGVAEAEGFSFDFDTLEVVNGFDLENSELIDADMHEWFELINAGRRYTAVGNSDSHRLVYQWAGYPRTYVRVQDDRPSGATPAEIARALIAGHALVSNGIPDAGIVTPKPPAC